VTGFWVFRSVAMVNSLGVRTRTGERGLVMRKREKRVMMI
jgi:hypothetical protein